jgi:transcriptional regulator with XRE-family HTH domain
MHRTYLGEIERGGANPTLEMVENLARALEVEACSLLGCAEVDRG